MATTKKPIKKAQVGIYQPMNEYTKFKTRSEDGNYRLKLKGDKLVERRTLKGFFSGAPRAEGRINLNTDDSKSSRSIKPIKPLKPLLGINNSSSTENENEHWYSHPGKYPRPTFKSGRTKNGGTIKKAKTGATVAKAKDGKWIQKATASIKKRGTAGKCTPITKPGCTGRAKALAKTFKKIAKSNKKK
jgi:hypothetical protein